MELSCCAQCSSCLSFIPKRAGVEGAISQATRTGDLRRSRYIGLEKTHLQNLAIAAALNLARVVAWLNEVPLAPTRKSRFVALAA